MVRNSASHLSNTDMNISVVRIMRLKHFLITIGQDAVRECNPKVYLEWSVPSIKIVLSKKSCTYYIFVFALVILLHCIQGHIQNKIIIQDTNLLNVL